MNPEYLTHSIVWSAVGLLVGYIIGAGKRVGFRYWELNDRYKDRAVGAFLILVALGSTIQSLSFQRNQREITVCQVSYNIRFQEVLRDRSAIGDQDRQNVNRMVTSVLTSKSVEETRKALEDYVNKNNELERARTQNPYPQLTGASCKELA